MNEIHHDVHFRVVSFGLPVDDVELVAVAVDQHHPGPGVVGVAGGGLVERRGDDLLGGASIRPSADEEGDALAELRRALDTETTFMLAEPGERGNELPDQSYRFVADDGGRLVGVIDVFSLRWRRARGRGAIVLGVHASHHGRGIGRGLLDAAIAEARLRGMWRLELTTMTHNQAALRLYEACGFTVEGLRRSSVYVDGEPVDEYYMSLLLDRASQARSSASAEWAS